jgi:hypothetical protein
MQNKTLSVSQPNNNDPQRRLVAQLKACPPNEAATLLVMTESSLAFEALTELNPSLTQRKLKKKAKGVSINSNFPAQPIRRAPLPELSTRARLDSLCPSYS